MIDASFWWAKLISLEPLICGFEHEDSVGDLEGGPKLDAHDLHDVSLGEQQQRFPVNHLGKYRKTYGKLQVLFAHSRDHVSYMTIKDVI